MLDYSANMLGLVMISVPSFSLGLAGIYVFAVRLHWLPTAGMLTIGGEPSLLDELSHLVLPYDALGLAQAAPLIRHARASMLEVIRKDFVRMARAKGLGEIGVIMRHALPNALLPIITVIALHLPTLVAGTVIIEQIFAWPGMGTLAITAINGRDYPIIIGFNFVAAVAIVASSLIADLAYGLVNPRIRYD